MPEIRTIVTAAGANDPQCVSRAAVVPALLRVLGVRQDGGRSRRLTVADSDDVDRLVRERRNADHDRRLTSRADPHTRLEIADRLCRLDVGQTTDRGDLRVRQRKRVRAEGHVGQLVRPDLLLHRPIHQRGRREDPDARDGDRQRQHANTERAFRRVRSVTDFLRIAVAISVSSLADDNAVADRDHPPGARSQPEVVGDVEHGLAFVVQALQQLEHLRCGLRIEVARGLVADDQLRISCEGPRNRNALLLPARELGRQVIEHVAETDEFEVVPAVSKRSRLDPRRAKSSGSIAFSSADRVGNSWKNWKTIPTLPPRQIASCSSLISFKKAARRPRRCRPSPGRFR